MADLYANDAWLVIGGPMGLKAASASGSLTQGAAARPKRSWARRRIPTSNRLALALCGPASGRLGAAIEVGDMASKSFWNAAASWSEISVKGLPRPKLTRWRSCLPVLEGRAAQCPASEARSAAPSPNPWPCPATLQCEGML
jgi:hypothetical protein